LEGTVFASSVLYSGIRLKESSIVFTSTIFIYLYHYILILLVLVISLVFSQTKRAIALILILKILTTTFRKLDSPMRDKNIGVKG
jgi:hypothetical protein